MKPELFKIPFFGGREFTVNGYGLMIAIGILAAYFLGELRARKRHWDVDTVFYVACWAVLGGAVGAKLLYYIVEIKDVIKDPSILLNISNGFVVYGGIIGGVLAVALYLKHKKTAMMQWFDVLIPSLPVAQGFGRLGCLMAGCCFGVVTDSPFHLSFTDQNAIAPLHDWLFPTQPVSAVLNFANAAILIFVLPRIFKKPGQVSSWYLILYSIGRFIIEFFRGDIERGQVGEISTSQFISIFILVIGVGMFILFTKLNLPVVDLAVAGQDSKSEAEKTEAAEAKTESKEVKAEEAEAKETSDEAAETAEAVETTEAAETVATEETTETTEEKKEND